MLEGKRKKGSEAGDCARQQVAPVDLGDESRVSRWIQKSFEAVEANKGRGQGKGRVRRREIGGGGRGQQRDQDAGLVELPL